MGFLNALMGNANSVDIKKLNEDYGTRVELEK